MADSNTARHQLPFLAIGQAQKEITHNEALLRIDALLHMVVESELSVPPTIPAGTQSGKCWLIGSSPTGQWQGKQGNIANWTGASWRFLVPVDRMKLHNKALGTDMLRTQTAWISPVSIANPIAGTLIDVESRAAINAILAWLRTAGIILA
jgi:Protein of unknown function (DUF2793)